MNLLYNHSAYKLRQIDGTPSLSPSYGYIKAVPFQTNKGQIRFEIMVDLSTIQNQCHLRYQGSHLFGKILKQQIQLLSFQKVCIINVFPGGLIMMSDTVFSL